MAIEEARITSVSRVTAKAYFLTDPDPLIVEHVDAIMSDGERINLYVAESGSVVVTDDDLIGLTALQARELAESKGLTQ
jgi:hypothetical protein